MSPIEAVPTQPVPVFPLPNAVLFPHGLLPLHVFELRYRTMLRDALASRRQLVMALYAPGWEQFEKLARPIRPLATLARVGHVEWRLDDCYDLEVIGEQRVRIARVEHQFPYVAARLEAVPEQPYGADDPLVQIELRALIEALAQRRIEAQTLSIVPGAVTDAPALEVLTNRVAMRLAVPVDARLELLALDDVVERAHRVRRSVIEDGLVPAPHRTGSAED
ncbi:MAG: LON peptidase substrate-binding domain-containing protein [Candidatus Eisenbacteria bacterium]|uniref:LON peptidase substrate-binding domain-containing protein n=1 Tax=Eiseniibacteriota bacterium TaxID=2212470 RepID=A0A849SU71_UNCEI|nr:LON peptidase substrate-binding domain-containing protein [Candidatus Eisenbacteria bacterium]